MIATALFFKRDRLVAGVIPWIDVGAFLAIIPDFCKQKWLAWIRFFPLFDLVAELGPCVAQLREGRIDGLAELIIVADADQIERIPKGDGFVMVPVGGVDQVSAVELADGTDQLEPSVAMLFHADKLATDRKQFDAVLLGDLGVMEDIASIATPPSIEIRGVDHAAPIFGAAFSESDDREEKDLESLSAGLVDGADQSGVTDGFGFVAIDLRGAHVFLVPTDNKSDVACACVGDIREESFVIVGLILEVEPEADTAKERMGVPFAPIGSGRSSGGGSHRQKRIFVRLGAREFAVISGLLASVDLGGT